MTCFLWRNVWQKLENIFSVATRQSYVMTRHCPGNILMFVKNFFWFFGRFILFIKRHKKLFLQTSKGSQENDIAMMRHHRINILGTILEINVNIIMNRRESRKSKSNEKSMFQNKNILFKHFASLCKKAGICFQSFS